MPTAATEKHLKTQLDELQRRYDALTKRISALDTDVGRELDSERKLVLEERRADLAAERDRVLADLTEIEFRLSGTQGTATDAAPGRTARDSQRGKTAPMVVGTDPPNGATNVPRDLMTIHIQFDRPMAPGGGSLSQKGGFGLGNKAILDNTADPAIYTVTRDNPGLLPTNTSITFTVNPDDPPGTGFVDLQGVSAETCRFSFTTGAEPTDKEWVAAQERASLQRQLAELRENLRLIEERESQFVQETDIPLQLIKEERGIQARIADLEQRLRALPAASQTSSEPGPAAIPKAASILFDEAHGQDRWFVEAPTINKGYSRIAAITAVRGRVAFLSGGAVISDATLSGHRAFVLPMGPQGKTQLADDEIRAVRAFVRAGGGLLVLSAYTGDWHHEANLNRLLEEYGIVFNRDVVMPANAKPGDGFSQGADCLPTSPSAVEVLPVEDEIGQPAANVRAALVKDVASALAVSSCSLYVAEGVAVSVLQSRPDSVILEPVPLGVGIHIQRYMERGRGPATVLAASTRSKVVVAGSWKMFLDAFIDHPLCGNQQLFRNILAWLLD